MSIYNIDQEMLIKTLLPVSKRTDVHIAWLKELLSQNQWLNDKNVEYIYGSTYSSYLTASTYNSGDRVNGGLYYNNAVYESITNSNINNSLLDVNSWELRNDNFIGVSERYNFIDQKITLEYALNREFYTTFRQPTGLTSWGVRSEIHIDDNFLFTSPFIMGPFADPATSTMYPLGSSNFMGVTNSYITGGTSYNLFTIYVPATVLASIPGGETGIKNFVDKYNYSSITYNVETY